MRELPPTDGLPLQAGDFFRKPPKPLDAGLAEMFGLPEVTLTCSGTAALVVILHTLRALRPRRDEVVVPAYTCPLVPLAVALVPGLHPVACDTAPLSFDFDPEMLPRLCSDRTLAVIPAHLGGLVADTAPVSAAALRCGAALVEDAAQAVGARVAGQSVGSAGDAAFFSLAAGKGLTTYEGGGLFSADPKLAALLRQTAQRLLRPHALWTLRRNIELAAYAFFYRPDRLRFVYGIPLRRALAQGREDKAAGDSFTADDIPLHSLDALRARTAANALPRLPAHLEAGRRRAAARLDALLSLPGVFVFRDRPGTEGTRPFFMLLMPGAEQRAEALKRLWGAGLGVSRLFVRALPDYASTASLFDGSPPCPHARDLAERMLTVSNSAALDEESFRHITETLRACLEAVPVRADL
ncbi:MAG: DegT/DnrJ/EryC1/StrS family aminotransferase [Desulfovibrio sp.]|jgi:dTDP-4-amino-4,6-dideoxygalactose transaminase|nr:DegT/DnrJ/EryC1/StrS family aminotransferase [Desulfovibrio sp.]